MKKKKAPKNFFFFTLRDLFRFLLSHHCPSHISAFFFSSFFLLEIFLENLPSFTIFVDKNNFGVFDRFALTVFLADVAEKKAKRTRLIRLIPL